MLFKTLLCKKEALKKLKIGLALACILSQAIVSDPIYGLSIDRWDVDAIHRLNNP